MLRYKKYIERDSNQYVLLQLPSEGRAPVRTPAPLFMFLLSIHTRCFEFCTELSFRFGRKQPWARGEACRVSSNLRCHVKYVE